MWTAAILMISLFVRLDNFIAVFVLLSLLTFRADIKSPAKMPLPLYSAFGILTIFICVWINYHFETNFWWFEKVTYVQSPLAYGYQLLIFCLSVSQSFFPALLLMGLFAYFYRKTPPDKQIMSLLAGIACIFLFRFLFFPSFEERFNTAYYLCGFLLVLEQLQRENNYGTGVLPSI